LHVADVHLERCGLREQQLLAMARALKPDLILFTGDFLNLSYVHDALTQQQAKEFWRAMSQLAPVYAVSGSPPVDPQPVVAKLLADTPVTWLRDEMHCIDLRGNHLHLVGVTCTHDPWQDGERLRCVVNDAQPSPRAALATRERGRGEGDPFTILLYHAPDLAPQAAELGTIDLHLAGHTHGGQVRLPWFGALLTASLYGKKLEMGLYQLRSMLLFVSRGVGLEGQGAPRVRFLCPPEVTLLELHGDP
jgi:predicted MPP superfamily phosphohydrolase